MEKLLEIVGAERNRIVLSSVKRKFIHVKFSQAFSKANAFNLALLAEAAYKDEKTIWDSLFKKRSDNDRAHLVSDAENISSAFLQPTSEDVEKVSDTFSFLEVKETDSQLFHFKTDGKPFILTGHSLGGALATLAAAYLAKRHKAKVLLYTFGSPLVGDAEFFHYFTKTVPFCYYRVVNNEDIITMIPPPYTNLRIGLVPLALVNPIYLIPATLDPFGKPFTHLGRVVFIRRVGGTTVSVDVDRKQPYFIKVPGKLVGNEDRPKWEKLIDWAPFCASDHSMRRYVSILASDLKVAVSDFLDSTKMGRESAQKTIDYLSKEIGELEARKDELEKELLMSPYPAEPDATATSGNRAGHQTPTEKLHKVSEALQVKHLELSVQKQRVTALSSPGYSQRLLREIIDLPISPSVEREFEYQKTAIGY